MGQTGSIFQCCAQDPETRCVMRGEQVSLVETEGCFDSLQAKQDTERWVTSGEWHSQGPTRALRWHPTGWHGTGR